MNINALFILQFANYLFPLMTFPYLVRVLGPEKFGLIIFAQAIIRYFITVTEFGFDLTGVRAISSLRTEKTRISKIFSTVLAVKFALMFFGFAVLLCLVFSFGKFREESTLYILTFGLVLETVLFPSWLFQGMQEMRSIAVRTVFTKLIYTFGIYLLVQNEMDYLLVPLINSASAVCSGGLGLWYAMRTFALKPVLPTLAEVRELTTQAWPVFVSLVAIRIYTNTNVVLLGVFSGNVAVGYYGAAERIIRISTELFRPIFQAIYPRVNQLVAESRDKALSYLRSLLGPVMLLSLSLFLFYLLFADYIVSFILGSHYNDSVLLFRILSLLIIFVTLGYIAANLTALPFRLDKSFFRIYLTGAIVNLLMFLILVGLLRLNSVGAALTTVFVEGIVLASFFMLLRKQNLRLC